MMNVLAVLIGAFLPLSESLPRLTLAAIFGGIGILAFFECVYLKSQAAAFGSRRISAWLMLFRVAVLVLFVCSAAISIL
jgi:hypothetical protein